MQQRRIVDVIAKKWDAVSAKEIANEIREDGKKMQTKLISAQLAQLEKNNVIEKKATTTKNHLYQLKERFFNIWYLMRSGDRRDRKRVAWLTNFLEMWYDDEDSKPSSSSILEFANASIDSDKLDLKKLDKLIEANSNVLKEYDKKYLPKSRHAKQVLGFQETRLEDLSEDTNMYHINELLINLMSRHQYHFLFKQFEIAPKLKDLLKPTYYALMTLMKDDMPNEIIKMGDELKSPVEDILERVRQTKVKGVK